MLNLGLLLAQLVLILAAARIAGALTRPIGQPPVIGEMIAGLALGPSVFGVLAPDLSARLFPADAMVPLAALSQLGVLLFMFVVGLRLDLDTLRQRATAAVLVSHASIVVPFAMGLALAPLLHDRLAPEGVGALPFALFVGAAMSVTAFPVLARILAERGLLGTRIGSVAIAAAAVDDVTAWCILAAVVAVARADAGAGAGAWAFAGSLLATALYVALMLTVGRRALAFAHARWRERTTGVSAALVSVAAVFALASAWVTEALGVHALFGAFLAGVVVPRGGLTGARAMAEGIADRIEDVVGAVLLPIFFAFTGLRTSLMLLDDAWAWGVAALVLAIAVAGKLGGSAIAARISGMSWRESLAIGSLMNTRGLMELVILNVGLDIGVISPALFAIMVVMALVTTVATSPLIGVLLRREAMVPTRA